MNAASNTKQLLETNVSIAEAAVRAGCGYYFGYPITPQSEIPEYLSRRLPEVGGVFLQAESELAAINMVAGCAGTGKRAMTSTSGPGFSLMGEGLSFLASAELPALIVNVMRAGPADGNITPAQGDYLQATRGGGHGDYNIVVLAPGSGQEAVDLVFDAFDLAEKYRTPVVLLADAVVGQMWEPIAFPEYVPAMETPDWALGARNRITRDKRDIFTYARSTQQFVEHNRHLQEKYRRIREDEQRWEGFHADDAELIVVAFGSPSRVAKEAVAMARAEGRKVGLIRPISLWPFPDKAFDQVLAAAKVRGFLVVELNAGQMLQDVQLAVQGARPIHFHGKMGGEIFFPREILRKIEDVSSVTEL